MSMKPQMKSHIVLVRESLLEHLETTRLPCECVHKKTGNVYVVRGLLLDCTNSRSGTVAVEYVRKDDDTMVFCREWREFRKKFGSAK